MKRIIQTLTIAAFVFVGFTAQAEVTVTLDVGKGIIPGDEVEFQYEWIGNLPLADGTWGNTDKFPVKAGETVVHKADAWNIKSAYRVFMNGEKVYEDNTIRYPFSQKIRIFLEPGKDPKTGKKVLVWRVDSSEYRFAPGSI